MTTDPLVDGRPASRNARLPPGQARDLANMRRETPCARCGGGTPQGAPLTAVEGPTGHQAWRTCPTCVGQRSASAAAWDVVETLGVPVRPVVGDDMTAVDMAVDRIGAPSGHASTRDTRIGQPPEGAPVRRWSHQEVADWLSQLQEAVCNCVLRRSPVGTPCPRCGRARDRSWQRTETSAWNARSVAVCSTCPTAPWGPRGPVTDDSQVRAAASEARATPWDAACLASAGLRSRSPLPGIAQLSGWYPAEQHPQWPDLPGDGQPWGYLPEGTAERVRGWISYITAPRPVPPMMEAVPDGRPARIR